MPVDAAVGDFAVQMQSRTCALANEVVREDLVTAVVLLNPVTLRTPDEVLIDEVRHVRGLDEDAAMNRLGVDDDVLAAPGIAVVPVHPDTRVGEAESAGVHNS